MPGSDASVAVSRFLQPHLDKRDRAYRPSFYVGDAFIGPRHETIEQLVGHVEGKLQPSDHLKLYEAGYFARGPILEVGRFSAKSTIILALGLRDAGHPWRITSVDIDDKRLPVAVRNLREFEVLDRVSFIQGNSSTVVASLPETFDTVFIDGDHSYDAVVADVRALEGRVVSGGVVLFHDYQDRRNADPDEPAFGVQQAVEDHAEALGLAYRGGFGSIGLYEQL